MNQFFSNKKLIILLISVIICLSLIAFSITGNRNASVVQQFTNDVTALTGRIFSKPANAVMNTIESVDHLMNTYEENQQLKSKIDDLYESGAELAALKEDNKKLKEQLKLESTLSEYSGINGTVIARNPDNWVDQLLIDKGSQNGVEMDMSVMSSNGYIGRIVEVSPTSSKVQLVTTADQNISRVAAQITTDKGPVHGIISGYDAEKNQLILNQITVDAELEKGDTVTTSGLGGVSPSSLFIGEIEEVQLDAHGLAQEAYISPAADIDDVRFVTVVKRNAESGE
ncbi:rod shape-determining protein MreC [Pisciglobus halotolerans]|uniref:Cell shape-determining protein MreC n=1 Tax=Pisciglobus halotolerans TaxID=745365 RepID=A0A1I3BV97_9LACT|nr:rod shape-determining protein MreC [Pisciglobus halotolerans]SFH66234.1 rod shape-determining protein MreC [Pisciglobus halotolerans]